MAQVKIKGLIEPVIMSNDRAREVKKLYDDDRVPNNTKIDLDTMSIQKGSIVGVFLENDKYQDDRTYNLDDKAERQMVYDFENALNGRKFLDYCIAEGIISAEKEEMPGGSYTDNKPYARYKNIIVIEPVSHYEEANKLYASLVKLRGRREWAKANGPAVEKKKEQKSAVDVF